MKNIIKLSLEGFMKLPKRHKEILGARTGLYGVGQTLQSIGDDLGISRERIRQLENDALEIIQIYVVDRLKGGGK